MNSCGGGRSGTAGADSTSEQKETDDPAMLAFDRFDYLRFTVADLHGIARSKSVSRRHFTSQFKDGITMYAGMYQYQQYAGGVNLV